MDTLGIVAIGIGAFLMFEAIKNQVPTPWKKATQILNAATGSSKRSTTGTTYVTPATGTATTLGA